MICRTDLYRPLVAYRQSLPCLGRTLLFWERLYYSKTKTSFLEQLELDGQIFFRVLAEIVDEFDAFGGELVDVGVELVVGE